MAHVHGVGKNWITNNNISCCHTDDVPVSADQLRAEYVFAVLKIWLNVLMTSICWCRMPPRQRCSGVRRLVVNIRSRTRLMMESVMPVRSVRVRELGSVRTRVDVQVFRRTIIFDQFEASSPGIAVSRSTCVDTPASSLPPWRLLDRLQTVRTDAAWLVYSTRKYDHVTTLLPDLHRLRALEWIAYRPAGSPGFSTPDAWSRYIVTLNRTPTCNQLGLPAGGTGTFVYYTSKNTAFIIRRPRVSVRCYRRMEQHCIVPSIAASSTEDWEPDTLYALIHTNELLLLLLLVVAY